jgi:hypothetical protein
MFESALMRKHGDGQQVVDPGLIAETLLFYANVHIVADHGTLVELLKTLGPENLLELLQAKAATITFVRSTFGTFTNSQGGIAINRFVAFLLGGQQKRLAIGKQLSLPSSERWENHSRPAGSRGVFWIGCR